MENIKSKQLNFYKIKIPKDIIIITIFAVVLNILRIVIWDKMSFLYILWNIFLAFIPFLISFTLLSFLKDGKFNKLILIAGFILWILFIPNAPYLVTDIIHLGTTKVVPILYDTLLLFSSAWLGMILFFYSLSHIEQIIQMRFSKRNTSIIIGIIILLVSFGIYIGRFLRFNSWDVFFNHTFLIKHVWEIFSQATAHMAVYLYTLLFFSFLYLFYIAWKYSNKND